MMKRPRVYVIHGYTASSRDNWFPWLRSRLEQNGIETHIPDMPFSNHPRLDVWLKHIVEQAEIIDEDTVLIGHSLGCVTVLRFLAEKNMKIKGAIFVSGFIDENPMSENNAGLQTFFEAELDVEKLKELIPKRLVITAVDDDIVPVDASRAMARRLDADLIVLDEGKHFIDRDGYTEFPVIYQAITDFFGEQILMDDAYSDNRFSCLYFMRGVLAY